MLNCLKSPQNLAKGDPLRKPFEVSSNEPMKTERILSGIAGEYFVAGELSRRGFVAGLTLRNNAGIDIVATTNDGSQSCSIQVKTRRIDKAEGWDLGSRPLETDKSWENIFYVFVALSSEENNRDIEYYIIPKNLLNAKLETVFQTWRNGMTKSGKARTSDRRIFKLSELPEFESAKDAWEIIFHQNQGRA
jgi:hypothetical protein